jgi:holin-like protein
MKAAKIIGQLAVLTIFYYLGVWIQELFDLFIPGSIIGMLLLLIALLTKRIKATWVSEGANYIIKHLTLLFIPVTVGIINYLDVFTGKGILLLPIALGSTLLVILSSGAVSQYLVKRREREYE